MKPACPVCILKTGLRCGRPGTRRLSPRRSGISCTRKTVHSPPPPGFRCSARVVVPITSACRLPFTSRMPRKICGATPSRRNFTESCWNLLGIFPCNIFGARSPTSSQPAGSLIRLPRQRAGSGRTSSVSTCPIPVMRPEWKGRKETSGQTVLPPSTTSNWPVVIGVPAAR